MNLSLNLLCYLRTGFFSQDYGEISLFKSKEAAARDVSSGLPLLYKVRFPTQNPLPRPTGIYLNNQLLCSGPKGDHQLCSCEFYV